MLAYPGVSDNLARPVPRLQDALDLGLVFPLTPLIRGKTVTGLFTAIYQSDTSELPLKYQTAQGQGIVSLSSRYPVTTLMFSLKLTIPALAVGALPYTSTFTPKLGSIDKNVFNEFSINTFTFNGIEGPVTAAVKQNSKATVLLYSNVLIRHSSSQPSLTIRFVEERTYATIPSGSLELDPVNTFELTNFYQLYRSRYN